MQVEEFSRHRVLFDESGFGLLVVISDFGLPVVVHLVYNEGQGQDWLDLVDLRECLLDMEDFSLVIFIFHNR